MNFRQLLLAFVVGSAFLLPAVDAQQKTSVPSPNLPFTISLENPTKLTFALQSFSIGTVDIDGDTYWLLVGGRTNGFHGTGGSGRTFPPQTANTNFVVFDKTTGRTVLSQAPDYLSGTNMAAFQDGNTLWLAGGYGCQAGSSPPACYTTFPYLTAIDLEKTVKAILAGMTPNVLSLKDPRFQVTGGALQKVGDVFYLVMGQNYTGVYADGITGAYTEAVAKYQLALINGNISVTSLGSWKDPQYHRRDLNVVEAVRKGGAQLGLNVFGGVFTPNSEGAGPYQNPVLIDTDKVTVVTPFQQQFNLYDSAHVLLYDGKNDVMATSLIGGITNLVLDSQGNPTTPTSGFMPFSQYVSTLLYRNQQNCFAAELPQAQPLLPGFLGATAEVVLDPAVQLVPGSTHVIDYSKLKMGDNRVGWMVGGILSTAEQTNAVSNPSFANDMLYEIHIQRIAASLGDFPCKL